MPPLAPLPVLPLAVAKGCAAGGGGLPQPRRCHSGVAGLFSPSESPCSRGGAPPHQRSCAAAVGRRCCGQKKRRGWRRLPPRAGLSLLVSQVVDVGLQLLDRLELHDLLPVGREGARRGPSCQSMPSAPPVAERASTLRLPLRAPVHGLDRLLERQVARLQRLEGGALLDELVVQALEVRLRRSGGGIGVAAPSDRHRRLQSLRRGARRPRIGAMRARGACA